MKPRNLFLMLFAATALVFGCKEEKEPEPAIPVLTVGQSELSFEQNGGTATVSVTSNRPWSISTDADWLAFNPSSGGASDAPVSVTVTALANASNDRTSSFKVKTDFDYKTVNVSQKGAKGEDTTDKPSGNGSLESPYNPAGVVAYIQTLQSDTESPSTVYISGIVSEVKTTYEASGNYGNAVLYISEDGSKSLTQFYVYQTYYLGNKQWKSGNTDIKVGDNVIICGKVINYNGKTPETVGKGGSYVYSLNGETGSSGGPTGEAKGSGTLEDPYNPTAAIQFTESLGKDKESSEVVWIKGKISKVATTYEASGNYGNATFYISEDGGTEGDQFYVYQTYYLANKQWKSGQVDVKAGDEVIICGKVINYRGNTPETVGKGGSYVYSLNGETGGDDPGPGGDEEIKTVTVAEFLAAEKSTTQPYKLTGKVSNIANNTYGNFDLTDASGTVYVYGLVSKDLGGYEPNKKNDKSFSSIGIKEGDEITIVAYRDDFTKDGETKIEAAGGYYVSGASGTGDDPGPGGDTEEIKTVTVAEFLAAEKSTTQPYKLTGKVSNIANNTYGNFDLTDASGTVYVYGLVSKDLGGYEPNKKNDKSFSSIGIKEGDEITIVAYRDDFTKDGETKIEAAGGYYVSGASGTGDDPGPGGDTEEIKTVTVAEFLAAEKSTTQPYKLTGKVSNIANNTYGNFDLTDASGTVYVYGLVSKDLGGYEPNKKNDKSFSSIGIKEGDEITIVAYRDDFTKDGETKIEAAGGYYVSGASGSGENPGGDTPGGDTPGDGSTISWKASTDWTGVADGAETISYKSGNFTITAKKEKSSNKPTVNGGANDCRVYAKGTLTITTSGDAMTSIVFNISSQGQKRLTDITANTGTVAKQAKGDKTVTWTGSANTVTFTVGEKAVYGSEGEAKAGQFDFSSVVIK